MKKSLQVSNLLSIFPVSTRRERVKPTEIENKKYGIGIYLCCNEPVGSGGHHLASDQDAQR